QNRSPERPHGVPFGACGPRLKPRHSPEGARGGCSGRYEGRMPLSSAARRRYLALCAGTAMVTSIWATVLLTVSADVGQTVSNVGLVVAPVAAALGCLYAAWRGGPYRRTWMFLGLGVLSWGLGQTLWTWYESVLGR